LSNFQVDRLAEIVVMSELKLSKDDNQGFGQLYESAFIMSEHEFAHSFKRGMRTSFS
jgi:hypothetical protein